MNNKSFIPTFKDEMNPKEDVYALVKENEELEEKLKDETLDPQEVKEIKKKIRSNLMKISKIDLRKY